MFDALTLLTVSGTFLIAGTVKGVIGLGLPTVSLALLAIVLGLPEAMGLLLIPSAVTNLWQALVGGQLARILRRLWPFLVMATGTVWIGATALTRVDLSWLSALLGGLLVLYAAINLAGFRLEFSERQERWAGPVLGAVNGLFTGMTGSFVVPGVFYLQAVRFDRDTLVQAMGVLFTASTIALALALRGNGLLSAEIGVLSAAALVPAVAGMVLGRRIRSALPEDRFRRVFFLALLILGGAIIAKAVFFY